MMVIKVYYLQWFFDKKSSGSGTTTEPNYELANELHWQIIRKFKKRKVH